MGPAVVSWTPLTTPDTGFPDESLPVTCMPSIDVAEDDCCALTMLATEVCTAVSSCTSSNDAVWVRNCAGSVGLVGLWFCSSDTSNCRNVLALTPFKALGVAAPPPAVAVSPAGKVPTGLDDASWVAGLMVEMSLIVVTTSCRFGRWRGKK